MAEDILIEIARRVGEGIATPAVIGIIALVILILYVRSQQSFMVPKK